MASTYGLFRMIGILQSWLFGALAPKVRVGPGIQVSVPSSYGIHWDTPPGANPRQAFTRQAIWRSSLLHLLKSCLTSRLKPSSLDGAKFRDAGHDQVSTVPSTKGTPTAKLAHLLPPAGA